MYCIIDMRYVDVNETNGIKLKNRDDYIHTIKYMLIEYIQHMHIRLIRTIMRDLFGNRIGRHNATQIRESWPWGQSIDTMRRGRGCGDPGLWACQGRQSLLRGRERVTQATG